MKVSIAVYSIYDNAYGSAIVPEVRTVPIEAFADAIKKGLNLACVYRTQANSNNRSIIPSTAGGYPTSIPCTIAIVKDLNKFLENISLVGVAMDLGELLSEPIDRPSDYDYPIGPARGEKVRELIEKYMSVEDWIKARNNRKISGMQDVDLVLPLYILFDEKDIPSEYCILDINDAKFLAEKSDTWSVGFHNSVTLTRYHNNIRINPTGVSIDLNNTSTTELTSILSYYEIVISSTNRYGPQSSGFKKDISCISPKPLSRIPSIPIRAPKLNITKEFVESLLDKYGLGKAKKLRKHEQLQVLTEYYSKNPKDCPKLPDVWQFRTKPEDFMSAYYINMFDVVDSLSEEEYLLILLKSMPHPNSSCRIGTSNMPIVLERISVDGSYPDGIILSIPKWNDKLTNNKMIPNGISMFLSDK
jgi:hypothetical protein